MMKPCLHCGKEMEYSANSNGQRRKFCSSACYHEHDRGYERVGRVTLACKQCGTEFIRGPGELRAYRKRHGRDPLYCSTACGGQGRKLSDEKWQVHCVQCGKAMPIQRKPGGTINRQKKLCSTACRSAFRAERAPKIFDGGERRFHIKRGYAWVSIPGYANSTGKKRTMLVHRYVMEQHLGRELRPEENVHHKNGQRADNHLENLELWSKAQPAGQRVTDKIAFAIDMARLYPDFMREAGYEMIAVSRA